MRVTNHSLFVLYLEYKKYNMMNLNFINNNIFF